MDKPTVEYSPSAYIGVVGTAVTVVAGNLHIVIAIIAGAATAVSMVLSCVIKWRALKAQATKCRECRARAIITE